jgi:hypothetical protein
MTVTMSTPLVAAAPSGGGGGVLSFSGKWRRAARKPKEAHRAGFNSRRRLLAAPRQGPSTRLPTRRPPSSGKCPGGRQLHKDRPGIALLHHREEEASAPPRSRMRCGIGDQPRTATNKKRKDRGGERVKPLSVSRIDLDAKRKRVLRRVENGTRHPLRSAPRGWPRWGFSG